MRRRGIGTACAAPWSSRPVAGYDVNCLMVPVLIHETTRRFAFNSITEVGAMKPGKLSAGWPGLERTREAPECADRGFSPLLPIRAFQPRPPLRLINCRTVA